MAETHNESAEREKKIIEEEGMSEDRYRERIDELDQEGLDLETLRDMVRILKNRPTRTEDAKVVRIKEKIEIEKKKAEERKEGKNKYIRWLAVFDDRFGAPRSIEVEVDEGSVANLITKGMADDHGFEIQSLGSEPFRGETVNGDVVCEEYVDLTLVGNEGQSIVATFYVLQANAPPNHPRITKPLVGRHLVKEPGGVLLSDDPKCPIWSTKMGNADAHMQEQSKQQAAKVQAYQANASRARAAAKKDQDGKYNKGSSSGVKNEEGK